MPDNEKAPPHRDPIADVHPIGVGAAAATAGVAGAALGAAVGGPVGAVVGAAVGAVAGGLGGKAAAEAVNPSADDLGGAPADPSKES
jgi:outer membrane lipoprotein SlyB